ncbi:hypothetical protein HK096_010315, partial [Nowakowskiella sp. JEL0078]
KIMSILTRIFGAQAFGCNLEAPTAQPINSKEEIKEAAKQSRQRAFSIQTGKTKLASRNVTPQSDKNMPSPFSGSNFAANLPAHLEESLKAGMQLDKSGTNSLSNISEQPVSSSKSFLFGSAGFPSGPFKEALKTAHGNLNNDEKVCSNSADTEVSFHGKLKQAFIQIC